MVSPIEAFGAGYNARGKVYSNGCAVFTYSNHYCFHIPDIIPKKKKPSLSSEIDFTCFSVSDYVHIFDKYNISYSFESRSYYFYHSFSFGIVSDWSDWSQMVSEYRETQKQGSASPAPAH